MNSTVAQAGSNLASVTPVNFKKMSSLANNRSGCSWVSRGLAFGLLCLAGSGILRAVNLPAETQASFVSQPLYFEANQGQAANQPQAQFLARTHDAFFAFSATEAVITLSKVDRPAIHSRDLLEDRLRNRALETRTIRLQFMGAQPEAHMVGVGELSGKVNYFVGNDPAKWRADIPLFSRVQVKDVYPGVEMVYYGNQHQLEYDFVVAPGADPNAISFQVSGTDSLQIDSKGDLIFKFGEDQFHQQKPIIYQIINGVRKDIVGGYRLKEPRTVAFELGAYDRSQPLV